MKKLSRRNFLKSSGLVIGMVAGSTFVKPNALFGKGQKVFEPNVWLSIDDDGLVNIMFTKSEMGQGLKSTWGAIVTDELGADLNRIKIIQPLLNPAKFGAAIVPGFGTATNSSSGLRSMYFPLRKAAAAAREMLQAVAAEKWKIDPKTCQTENHKVIGPNNKSIDFSKLVFRAAKLPIPKEPKIRSDSELDYIAKDIPHLDAERYARGQVKYGMDIQIPNMKYASLVKSPVLYSQIESYDDTEALKVPGVEKVVKLLN